MAVIRRSACVPYSAQQMLILVSDIEAYPDFLHWCHDSRIEQSEGSVVEAALAIGIRGIHRTMRTRNTTIVSPADGSARIEISMLDGPLKRLQGSWQFSPVADNGCEVVLELEYETHRTPFGLLLRALFDEIANSQLHAFVKRAARIYADD
jgi:ribosome-associated toxin RatA of RatAB toxin-antitoxin module